MLSLFFKKMKSNWKSGLSVSLVSLPLAVSLSVASNTTPVAGIVTAIWAGFIASIFGGSNYNIIGPTGALTGILAGYALTYGPASLSMLAIFSGIFIFFAFLFKLEKYIILFPSSSIHGFILGVAGIIILTQLNTALGLTNLTTHESIIKNTVESFSHISQISIPIFIFFLVFLFFLLILPKFISSIPSAILLSPIAILIGFLSTKNIFPLALPTLESKYANISASLFLPHKFWFSFKFIIPSLIIALIAIIETMISARIADGMTKTKHNKRREMLGLSLANIVSGIAGGIPATAALARTALNIKTGGNDKLSATLCCVFLLIISIILLPYFKFMPLCAIAAMLVFVAIKMIEKKHFIRMYKADKKNFLISILVAATTIYEDPIVGILLGATISMLLIMTKLSEGHFELTESPLDEKPIDFSNAEKRIQKANTIIYSIKGKLAYINAQSHLSRFENNPTPYENIIFDLKDLYFLDLDGVEVLGEIINILHSQNKTVLISGTSHFIEKILNESHEFKVLKVNGLVFTSNYEALLSLKNKRDYFTGKI